MTALSLTPFALALTFAVALAAPPLAAAQSQRVLLPFEDPFAPGVAPDCATLPEREHEKLDCRAEAAVAAPQRIAQAGGAVLASASTPRTLPAFEDPFAPGNGAPLCDMLDQREREKFGFAEECAPASTGASAALPDPVSERAAAPEGSRPLAREDIPDLYRRVLSLPGARIAPSPSAADPGAPELPAFTVFYVYEEAEAGGTTWLRVGQNAFGETDGWLRTEEAEDWRTMLVMQYASKGSRGPVLFFKRRNDLVDFATDRYVAEEVRLAYEEIEEGEYDDDFFIAMEPALGVAEDNVYLMPILDHRLEFSALGEPLRLLEVASLNTEAGAEVQTDVREAENRGVPRRAGALRRLKVGVVFLIDTTRSMGPYIEHTRAIVNSTVAALEQSGNLDAFSFGLVGFRDNTDVAPRVEYVSKVFQPLDPNADQRTVLRNFELMEQARAPTDGFSEDAFAGLYTAINGLDWSPFDARLLVMITDAAPRDAFDPLVAYPGYSALNVVDDANRNNISMSVMHLITPQGIRAGNVDIASPIYREIARSGDSAFEKYLAVDTRDPDAFVSQVRGFQASLLGAVETLNRSRPVEQAETATPGTAEDLGQVLVNEIFRAQLEYLGADRDQEAPRFYRAWAADRDLQAPTVKALDVKVFLTRNQLAALNKGVETILEAYLRKDTGGGDFFDALQALSAETSVEGGRTRTVEKAGALLPSFLSALPYRSDFLTLDKAQWQAFGPAGQRQKIDDLQSKLLAYRALAESRTDWKDLGAGDRGLEVTPMQLNLLP